MYKNYLSNRLINVLLLDSEEKVLKITKSYFLSNNINIIIAKSVSSAETQLKKKYIDCLIIDTSMSNNQSFKFIQKSKNDPKLQHIPFIILTSRGFVKDRLEGYKSGCAAYLSKPFDPVELYCMIINLVDKKNLLTKKLIANYFLLRKLRFNIIKKYKNSFKENSNIFLTPKEELVLSYLLINKNIAFIAKKLKIHTRTIEKSITKLLDKTQTKNNKELKILPWTLI